MVSLIGLRFGIPLLGLQTASKNYHFIIIIIRTGKQSPINLDKPYSPEEIGLTLNLQEPKGNITLHNDGYKLIIEGDFGSISHGAHTFNAYEIHIHHPSEHTFNEDEIRSPMEIQIICKDKFGNRAGIAVLFEISEKDNEFLRAIGFGVDDPIFAIKLRNSETVTFKTSNVAHQLDLGKILKNSEHYITYVGSLTSPPCLENVRWFVLLQKLGVSQTQLEYFPVLFGQESNVRGLQPLNDRVLEII